MSDQNINLDGLEQGYERMHDERVVFIRSGSQQFPISANTFLYTSDEGSAEYELKPDIANLLYDVLSQYHMHNGNIMLRITPGDSNSMPT
jgi:hypothetical protein